MKNEIDAMGWTQNITKTTGKKAGNGNISAKIQCRHAALLILSASEHVDVT